MVVSLLRSGRIATTPEGYWFAEADEWETFSFCATKVEMMSSQMPPYRPGCEKIMNR